MVSFLGLWPTRDNAALLRAHLRLRVIFYKRRSRWLQCLQYFTFVETVDVELSVQKSMEVEEINEELVGENEEVN